MLELKNLSYKYNNQEILKNINYTFEKGKIYSIVGESGVGKTTFLSLISGLEFLQQGEIFYKNKIITNIEKFRREISYIFQSFNLIPYLSAMANVQLALDIHKKTLNRYAVEDIFKELGIKGDSLVKKCSNLSGGQQQRVAIARAVALEEDLIIGDEPTGNLDKYNAKIVLDVLKNLRDKGKCVIIVTHDRNLANTTDVILTLKKGELVVLKE